MKKIQSVKSIPFTHFLPLLVLGFCSFLSSCDFFAYKQPYSDAYYDNNFIANIGFDKFVGNSAPAPSSEVTGQWDLAYRYEASWDSYNYMTLTDTTHTASYYGAASKLSGNAPVYKLEVVNLIAGGDFETDESATWSGTGTAAWKHPSSVLFGAGCMKLDALASTTVQFQSTAFTGYSFASLNNYNVFFRYQSNTYSANVSITPSTNTILQTLNPGVTPKNYFVVLGAQGLTSAPLFTFAPVAPDPFSDIYVDNFRVGRSGNMDLRLLLTIPETIPKLESGTYSFSVWVCTDPMATDTKSPYHVDAFGVKMIAAAGTSHIASSTATYGITSGWTKLTANLTEALTFASGETRPVLQLDLDCNVTRPGSVLLAQPELRFYPDGL